jgi:hypothetical protein
MSFKELPKDKTLQKEAISHRSTMAMQIHQTLDPTQTKGSEEAPDTRNTCEDFSSLEVD